MSGPSATTAATALAFGSTGPVVDLRNCRHDQTSQWGENGVIEAVFHAIGSGSRVCLECGAYDLKAISTVYPLWANEGWRAILVEGDPERVAKLRHDYEAARSSRVVTGGGSAVIVNDYVLPAGPRSLPAILREFGVASLDLLVIDVDGQDYNLFKHFDRPRPRVVVCEFNPTIPPHIRVAPNEADVRNFTGCSVLSLYELARFKGYSLVACTRANAVFVADEEGPEQRFAHVNDLSAHFDPWAITYFMTSYDGGVFLSRSPAFSSNILSARPTRELPEGDGLYIPRSQLSRSYWLSRAAYEALGGVYGPLATRAVQGLRWVRASASASTSARSRRRFGAWQRTSVPSAGP